MIGGGQAVDACADDEVFDFLREGHGVAPFWGIAGIGY